MPFAVAVLESTAPNFPPALRVSDKAALFPRVWAIGNMAILEKQLLGFFCSIKCPGEIILQTYDLARALRDANVSIISGFHSPMEKECLTFLLRGSQPIVVCPARSLERMRVPSEWRAPLAEGRLLILSPFTEKTRRATTGLAQKRNEFVAALAEKVFVAHAAPESKTEQFCCELLRQGKPLLTLENDQNANLLTLGARPVRLENVSEQWAVNSSASIC
ncbi:MAG TPA: DNA-processing protein DprA [Methylomirabilota bacterium]|nr:DNA-processing protein DprA [Methylomirabilota bacterium]